MCAFINPETEGNKTNKKIQWQHRNTQRKIDTEQQQQKQKGRKKKLTKPKRTDKMVIKILHCKSWNRMWQLEQQLQLQQQQQQQNN